MVSGEYEKGGEENSAEKGSEGHVLVLEREREREERERPENAVFLNLRDRERRNRERDLKGRVVWSFRGVDDI